MNIVNKNYINIETLIVDLFGKPCVGIASLKVWVNVVNIFNSIRKNNN